MPKDTLGLEVLDLSDFTDCAVTLSVVKAAVSDETDPGYHYIRGDKDALYDIHQTGFQARMLDSFMASATFKKLGIEPIYHTMGEAKPFQPACAA